MRGLWRWIIAVTAIVGGGVSIPLAASETPNTYTNYAWPAGTVLTSVDFTTTVTDDPGHSANVFWSNQFDFEGGGTAYTGMQTNGGKPRNFLFSVWKATEARPGSPGSHCEDFQENGAGKTCGIHFDWQQGHAMRFPPRRRRRPMVRRDGVRPDRGDELQNWQHPHGVIAYRHR